MERNISKNWWEDNRLEIVSCSRFCKTPYVDGDRMAAVGASYGGYSVFMLAGVHENRFKTFIAHDGLFDMKSWYGTTEEWFCQLGFRFLGKTLYQKRIDF